ncbi:MAG: hypothetical protein ACRDZ1_17545 [Acidimicrobiia bacterium]
MGSIADDIRDWMEQGGRPLEMEVAAAFMKSTPTVEQAPFYTDAESGKPREIDVVALYSGDARPYVVSVEVECKAKAEPFIVLLPSQYDTMQYRCLSRHARSVMPDMRHDIAAIDLNGTALFDPSVSVGHSILTKARSNEDRPDKGWSAAMVAAKAAHWFATRFDDTEHTECHIAFPVVVTDAVLATAELVGGQTQVAEVDHSRFVLKWPMGDTPAVIVDVVRASALPGFVNGCAKAAQVLLAHVQKVSGAG